MYTNAQEIIETVAKDSGISVKRLTGSERKRTITMARHKAIRMVKIECGMSLSEIGELFNRDPSSISRVLKLPYK